MPIFARLEGQAVVGQKVRLDWGFFDPAGPFEDDEQKVPAVFYRESMTVPPSDDLIKIVTEDLMAIGKRVAQAQQISKSLAANVPVGTELQVG